jgi:hypothetical protein
MAVAVQQQVQAPAALMPTIMAAATLAMVVDQAEITVITAAAAELLGIQVMGATVQIAQVLEQVEELLAEVIIVLS